MPASVSGHYMMLGNANKHHHVEACLHFIASTYALTQECMLYKSKWVEYDNQDDNIPMGALRRQLSKYVNPSYACFTIMFVRCSNFFIFFTATIIILNLFILFSFYF